MSNGTDKTPVPHCLVISDGRRGMENQALGLAEACARLRPLTIQTHHVPLKGWKTALPAGLQSRLTDYRLPDCYIAIGCGRRAIPPLLQLKRKRPEVFTVYVQDPRIDPAAFDLVIAPEHDAVRGPNVVTMIGSPNRITAKKLTETVENFAGQLAKYPPPRATLLIGGSSKTHELTEGDHMFHVEQASKLLVDGYSVLITTSRRTPDFAKTSWRNFANGHDRVWLYEGDEPNPYFAFLGAADLILVTEDSTNMLTEACNTGKPVYRLQMTGDAGKFQTLYEALERRCGAVPFAEQIVATQSERLIETDRVAELVCKKMESALN